MTTTRRVFLGGAACLPVIGGLAAVPLLGAPARAQAAGGHLRFGLSAFPPNLAPWVNVGAAAGTGKLLLHRSLTAYDKSGALVGDMAQSYALDHDGAWVFKLRPGMVFHDGGPVTADDVKWSIEQVAGASSTAYMRQQFQQVAKIETPDALTVRLVTKVPLAILPSWFANYAMFIVSRKSTPANWIGAGPFTLESQERGTSLELKAFAKYYRPGLPKLARISFIAYPDENLRAAALHSGDVDMIDYVPWQSMEGVIQDPKLKLAETQGAAFMDLLFNGTRPPFADPRVRQAVAHAVKREDIVKAAFYGRGKILEGVPVEEGTPFYDAKLAAGWAYDPEKSKQLLAAAGYAKGFKTVLLGTAQYAMHKDTAEVVQQYLAAIGITCELKLPDWSTRVAMGTHGQYDVAVFGTAADNNDPDGLASAMDTSLPTTYGRSFGLKAPRTAAAFTAGRAEFDLARRVAIYREMQAAALEEVPIAGLCWRSQAYGMSRKVQGFTNLPGALSTSSGGMLQETSIS